MSVTILDNYAKKDQEEEKTSLRHPEKKNNIPSPRLAKPSWLKVRAPGSHQYEETRSIVRRHKLHTVCEEAACPNIGECWTKKHATIMIMGDTCTRGCAFCNVRTGKPGPLDKNEPEQVGQAAAELKLNHIVITSVARDDLEDGGAEHFARTVLAIRRYAPLTTIEILIPDFLRRKNILDTIVQARPDVVNHNIETVPRKYLKIRPGARYYHSLNILDTVKEKDPTIFTKSGLMLGLGETREEVLQVMDDMRVADVDFLTLGQYLQPTPKHEPVSEFVTPEDFKAYEVIAYTKGFLMVASHPLVRSSYHADEDFQKLREKRRRMLPS